MNRQISVRPIAIVLMAVIWLGHGRLAVAQASRTVLVKGTLAIEHVAVVPMTSEIVANDQTVLIRDGRIAAIGLATQVVVPTDARRVDGRGKFLMPGLADMHVHLFADDSTPKPRPADEFGVMLANGVTAIRLMIGTPDHLAHRRAVETGELIGPQMWVASPQFTGRKNTNARVVTNPDEARRAVKDVADAGYDFIKLTLHISPPVFDAIASEAARNGIRIVGHVDPRVGVRRALAAGQHIEHLDNYIESVLVDDAPSKAAVSDLGVFNLKNWESLDHIDDQKVEEIAEATATARVWTCPTLTIFRKAFAEGQSDAEIRGRPDWLLQPEKHRAMYLRAHERYWKNPPSEARRRRYVELRNRLVRTIAAKGGRILAGSDAPEWFLGYGFTLHRELESLVDAGLTPYQALATCTRNPAEFLHALGEWGTIETRKRADLVLLNANPLADIRNTTKIAGVSLGGRWFAKDELTAMIRQATASAAR